MKNYDFNIIELTLHFVRPVTNVLLIEHGREGKIKKKQNILQNWECVGRKFKNDSRWTNYESISI